MNPDKKIIVDQLVARLGDAPYMLLVDYTGLTMPQFTTIRKRLREVDAKFHVTKNSYIKAAGEAKNYPSDLQKDLAGQTAVVYGDKDVCAAAKVISGATKEFQKPVIKSGVLDGTFLNAKEVQGLADVGSKENLLAKLLGVLNAPAAAIARAIAAKIEKDGGGAPEPEVAAEPEAAAA
jgi:large subunit ribosomal protein L10